MHPWNPIAARMALLVGLGLVGGIAVSGCPVPGDDDDATGDDDASDDDGDPATIPLAGPCGLAERRGGFVVEAYEGSSIVDGTVEDATLPLSVLEEVAAEAGCRLMKRNNPFCDPPCAADETCDHDGQCIPYPEAVDLGTVTVSGLSAPVSMEPVMPGYSYFETTLPHPAFEPMSLITLKTSGGALDPFTLHGVGVDPLEVAGESWVVEEGQPLAVAWTPPAGESRSTVDLRLNIDQHGLSPVTLWCALDDSGTGEVPAALVAALFGAGVSGYPSGSLGRRTADSIAVGGGCVDLIVASPRILDVDVAGYIPCDGEEDCPDELDCNEITGLCE